MSDNSWDEDYSDDDYDFEEESIDQTPLSPDPPPTTTTAKVTRNISKTRILLKSSSSEDDNYDYDFDEDEQEQEQEQEQEREEAARKNVETPQSLPPPQAVSSPRMKITDRGRGRHASLLAPLESLTVNSLRQYSKDLPDSPPSPINSLRGLTTNGSHPLNLPVWKESETHTNDQQSEPKTILKSKSNLKVKSSLRNSSNISNSSSRRNSKVQFMDTISTDGNSNLAGSIKTLRGLTNEDGSLSLPSWDETSFENNEETKNNSHINVKEEFPFLFNRDLIQTKGEENQQEYLSPSTSAAVAMMMKRSWAESKKKKSKATTEHETDRVLAWLADVAQPKAMSYIDNNQWITNPKLQEPKQPSPSALSSLPPPPHTSSIMAALADPPAIPGSLEENVLEVVYTSLMDELMYPRKDKEDLYQKEYERATVDDRGALESLRRNPTSFDNIKTTHPSSLNGYSLPNDMEGRAKAEKACEQSYLNLVKRACLDHPGRSKDLAKASGVSVELARKVQKELIGAVCEMFTDPTIVSTIKTAVLSRVFAGRPLEEKNDGQGRNESP